jgi:outer membrane protein OmpA-like peptidoglycan-associated protein
MGFLGRRVREEGMTMSGLGSMLQREAPTIQNALPAGLRDLFWHRAAPAAAAAPVVAQTVTSARSSTSWLPALALAALALGFFWLLSHARRPVSDINSMVTGTANRVAAEVSGLGEFVNRRLPNNVNLNVPVNGVESRLLMFVQNPNAAPDQTTWFTFDRLVFDTGSANLRPESQEQLSNIAAILAAYPNVHLKIGGYTDNVGGGAANLELSQARANAVKSELVRRGISPDRLTAEGYGEQYPVADNSTPDGRARNRRVSMRVTQK